MYGTVDIGVVHYAWVWRMRISFKYVGAQHIGKSRVGLGEAEVHFHVGRKKKVRGAISCADCSRGPPWLSGSDAARNALSFSAADKSGCFRTANSVSRISSSNSLAASLMTSGGTWRRKFAKRPTRQCRNNSTATCLGNLGYSLAQAMPSCKFLLHLAADPSGVAERGSEHVNARRGIPDDAGTPGWVVVDVGWWCSAWKEDGGLCWFQSQSHLLHEQFARTRCVCVCVYIYIFVCVCVGVWVGV